MSLSDYVSVFCSSFAPESTGIIIPFSGSDSTYTGVQILGTTSFGGKDEGILVITLLQEAPGVNPVPLEEKQLMDDFWRTLEIKF